MADKGRVNVRADVVFGQGGGRDLRCDVYEPPEEKRNGAAVLLLHGGSWLGGDRTQLRGYGILLGREGYTCVASEYRLLGESPWPAQIHDAKAALRWMRANADELGIDPAKIAVEGNSAGAHLALLVAGTAAVDDLAGDAHPGVANDVAACMAVYPPTLLTGIATTSTTEGGRLLGRMFGDGDEGTRKAEQASPLHHAGAQFPPTLLIHGSADTTVPIEASLKMFQALAAAGVPTDLHVFADQPHAFDAHPEFGRLTAAEMLLFLNRYVLKTTKTLRAPAEPAVV
jgi:acetyl esterase/lipase